MNYSEQFVTFTTQATSNYGVAYLMCDEVFNAIEFSDLVTTGTISSDYLVIFSSPIGQFDINFYGPVTITFNPSSLNFNKKINKIEYYINGELTDIRSFYYAEPSVKTNSYPFPQEPGDPRNYRVTKTFNSETYSIDKNKIDILVYQLGVQDPSFISYNINIIPPNIDDYDYDLNPYFGEMHLISTRMFGPNNDILYTFETKNPNYIVPVVINWQKQPIPISNKTIQTSTTTFDKKYRILQPYEIANLSNNNIKIITQAGNFKALNF